MNLNNGNGNGVSFLKILLKDNVDYLPLPPSFAKKYLMNKKQTLVLKTKSTDLKWKVKFLEIEDRYYFMDGWLKFIKDNNLQMGDFLVFWRLSPSIFQVFLYAPDGCLKNPTTFSGAVAVAGGGKNGKILKKPFVKEESTSDDDSMEDVKQSLRRVVTKRYMHRLSFLKDVGINGCYSLRLKNDDGKVWVVKVRKFGREKSPFMATGWFDFRKDNKIQIGDLCEFKHVKANLLRVHIFKKGKQPMIKKR